MDNMKTPIIVVLGMHRSGTSVGMNVLSGLGVACGEELIPAGRSNLAGFWEHSEIVAIQERCLARLNRVWHGPHGTFPMPNGWLNTDAAREAEKSLTDVVARELAAHPGKVWGFKDPRTIRLWLLWQRIWDTLGIVPIPVLMVRHPDAVSRSLAKHNGISPKRGQLVWLQHNIEALRHFGDQLRIVIDFDDLVNDPDAEVERIANVLTDTIDITADARAEAKVRISTNLRTHKSCREVPENALIARVYATLREQAVGHGTSADIAEIVTLYDAAEDLFESWRSENRNVLTDWVVRFLVSRKNG